MTDPEEYENEAKITTQLYPYSDSKGQNGLVQLVEWAESTYNCSGMCGGEVFYYTQSIAKGIPTQGCGQPVSEDFGAALGSIGAASVVCGLFLFLTFLSSYCLWKNYDESS